MGFAYYRFGSFSNRHAVEKLPFKESSRLASDMKALSRRLFPAIYGRSRRAAFRHLAPTGRSCPPLAQPIPQGTHWSDIGKRPAISPRRRGPETATVPLR